MSLNIIPKSDLSAVTAQLSHRLLSLEAELKDRARGGGVSAAGYLRRARKLAKARATLAALEQLAREDAPDRHANYDVGLPVLETCTPPERAVCEEFLTVSGDTVAAAAEEITTVHKWIQEAASGRGIALVTTLRLAKMKKLIAGHEERFTSLTGAAGAQDAQAERIVSQYKGKSQRAIGRSSLESLSRIYDELDTAIGRVARLKTAFKREETKARKMTAMIRSLRDQVRSPMAPVPPPEAGALVDAVMKAEELTAPAAAKAQQRRALVEMFWQDVLKKPPQTPTPVELEGAAKALEAAREAERAARKTPPPARAGLLDGLPKLPKLPKNPASPRRAGPGMATPPASPLRAEPEVSFDPRESDVGDQGPVFV